jgi:GAF domain-containing protein
LGDGVCGTAAVSRTTQRVADVQAFAGHIACDLDSRSEIVVPLVKHEQLIGVLDIDSPQPDRFSAKEQALLEEVALIYLESID